MKTITIEGVEYVAVDALDEVGDLHRDLHRGFKVCGFCPFKARGGPCTPCAADELLGACSVLIPADLLPILKMRMPPGTLQHS